MLGALSVSHTGLNAARYAIDNIGNNQANENTPGYKKRVVQLSEIGQVNGIMTGRGVYFDGVYRVTSQYMYDKLIGETSKVNYHTKLSNMVANVESVFKETADSGFSVDLSRYFQSIENLRTNPNSEVYKSALKKDGEIIVNSLKNSYANIEEQQKYEKIELNANIEKINNILNDIGEVNDRIEKYHTATNDLLDKRDYLELELSQYVDISVIRDGGFYELKIGDTIAISNNTTVRKVELNDIQTSQVDKFNHIQYSSSNNTFEVFDSLKYNEDFTSKGIDLNDVVTYKLNNLHEVSVTIGESLTIDWGDGAGVQTRPVDIDNLTRAMVHKINEHPDLKGTITAFNGDYAVDAEGKKITDNTIDHYLRIESNIPGVANSFEGRVSIEKKDNSDPSLLESRASIYKNEVESNKAKSDVGISIYERDITLKSGLVKAQTENLSTSSPNNKYQQYLDELDAYAMTLADIGSKYIKELTGTGEVNYTYGVAASDESNVEVNGELLEITNLLLFNGSNVKSLQFNSKSVNDLKQEQLDYLATIQWKQDLNFGGKGQNSTEGSETSMKEFYRNLRIMVSADKESNDFLLETQINIHKSIETSYNNLVKVDKDDEMLNLMKFQAAFTANAQIITAVNEMIQTILGMRR